MSDVRADVMAIWDVVQMAQAARVHLLRIAPERWPNERFTLDTLRSYLMFAAEYPSRRRRTPVNIDDMVAKWVSIIRGLATAHDKATLDHCEFVQEEHLTPLLAAPVKQLRDFYAALVSALKNDPAVPFFVWAMFEGWGETILKNASDSDVRELKDQLAEEIATLVEKDVQPDLRSAIAGALRWRSQEALEKIKTAVRSGAKARMVGKESCLFLEVANERVML